MADGAEKLPAYAAAANSPAQEPTADQSNGEMEVSGQRDAPDLHFNGSSTQSQPPAITAAEEQTVPEEVEKTLKEQPSVSEDDLEADPEKIKEQLGSVDTESLNEEDEFREKEVQKLVRRITSQSSLNDAGAHVNPFETNPGSRYDPNSPSFSARAWARRAMEFQRSDPTSGPPRSAGFAFRNLNVFGYGSPTDYQKSVSNVWLETTSLLQRIRGTANRRIDILRGFEGVVYPGELLVVLGPPGSGCTTFLKTISGEMDGLSVQEGSYINYQGIDPALMHKNFRGEAIYTAEVDVHFPQLTVADTLTFAARARAPRHIPGGLKMEQWADHIRDVVMAMYGISHTKNTRVGNDFVRGVSGGERKRVTIAEATLSGAPLQCWDNSTRGLDSANAIEFCKILRLNAEMMDTCAAVSIYQAPQSAYDLFDKVLVLYEGRQIFFGKCNEARQYFEQLGFDCPDRQTTADFLTSMTSPLERVVRPGWDGKVPQTPDDFALRWRESAVRKALREEIDMYDEKYTLRGEHLEKFKESRRAQQSKLQTVKSPFTLSYPGQVQLCLWRGFQRLKGDPSLTFVQIIANSINALVISSVFYNLQPDTNSFFSRGSLIFFAVLMNAFGSALEILTLYAQRPIVEKQSRYAFYHPSAEALSSMIVDLPNKIGTSIGFNLVLYFMTNLRRAPGYFFFFLLVSFTLTLVMSMFFRFLGSVSRTLPGAMTPAAVFILAIIIFTGFVIPTKYMLGWCRWINYVDPIAYGFEALMINEFHDRNFTCSRYVPSGPGYEVIGGRNQVCAAVGSVLGQNYVNGDAFINSSYDYYSRNKWRNVGILFGFILGFMAVYLIAAELVSSKKSKGEVLVFRRGKMPSSVKSLSQKGDLEANDKQAGGPLSKVHTQEDVSAMIQRQTSIFSWRDVCFDIKIKSETRRILDHVDGWVKPGTLTALMGVSGAGKTTLLDALATRTTIGVLTGEMLVDGRQRDQSFQRKTGYVQQQDLHLATQTVREALNFSALLRQPRHIPRKDKLAYVDEVIKLLDMEEYAEAVVGVPGEGLNVEQRKRLTIGVELAAKPQLLLFLDEPTSGLDSQTSWAICDLMEKLTNSGQAILCTIHQPSAMLFQRFSRLLFLQKGGQTVYFGEIGKNSRTMIEYFERYSRDSCPKDANPAEWMLEVIGAAPGSHTDVDWFETWRESPEYQGVHRELDRLKMGDVGEKGNELTQTSTQQREEDAAAYATYAAPFREQMWEVQKRVFEQYWRTPGYIYSKILLCFSTSLFVGFVFYKAPLTQQGLQNQLFAIFMLLTIFGQLAQQMMPLFVTQRALYEVRERPSKSYNWQAFIIANIVVELAWQSLMAVGMFFCFYYPVGMNRNAVPAGQVHERGALFFLYVWLFLVFASTFTHMVIAAVETTEAGGNIVNLLFSMCLIFCGVLANPQSLPGFWIFMYRVSPFTYLIAGFISTGLANTAVTCAENEYLRFNAPANQTCGAFMANYIAMSGGYMQNPASRSECSYCSVASTNVFLASINASYGDRWRNFGILWAFVIFDIAAALALYYFFRVPKGSRSEDKAAKTGTETGLLGKLRGLRQKKQ